MADPAKLVEQARTALRAGDLAGAESAASQALTLEPEHPQLLNLLGLVTLAQRRFADADRLFERAIARDRRAPEFHHNRGIALKSLGRGADAVASFRRARDLAPSHPEILFSLGTALFGEDRLDEATAVLRRVAALAPDRADIRVKLGDTLLKRGRFEEARVEYESAFAAQPSSLDAVVALAFVRYRLGDHAGAESLYRQALSAGRTDVTVLTTLGALDNLRGDFEAAERHFREAIALDPAIPRPHLNLGGLLLLTGRLEEGWKEYRAQAATTPGIARVESLSQLAPGSTIALHGEQGLGDELFFLRWLPGLRSRGFKPRLHLSPRLAPLLVRSASVLAGELGSSASDSPEVAVRVGDLPPLLWGGEPYPSSIRLVPSPPALETLRARMAQLGPPPYIGVAWRAGTPLEEQGAVAKVLSKAVPIEVLARILAGARATVVSVQRNPEAGETDGLARFAGLRVHDLSATNTDLEEALALMALLDEYVGVSSTNVHLRHAVGRPSKVLIPNPPEWRWGARGESPWFPGTAVYREVVGRGWDEAATRLRRDVGLPA
jgi:Flp pilus assembly protein TadD